MPSRRGHPPVLKRLGQHFLYDDGVLQGIANAVAPLPDERVIEIGPGRGALTDILASRKNPLIAVEIDHALSDQLRTRYAANPRVTIVVRQITGAIARRIVAWAQIGDELKKGERFGMIRFGSRTELYLPLNAEVLVKVGDHVLGGSTIIARLPD